MPLWFWKAADRVANLVGLEIVFVRDVIETAPANGYRTYQPGRMRVVLKRDTGR